MMHRRVGNLTQCANSLLRNEQIYKRGENQAKLPRRILSGDLGG